MALFTGSEYLLRRRNINRSRNHHTPYTAEHSSLRQDSIHSTTAMSTEKSDRIQALCKHIWGSHCDYDIEYETDDNESYYTFIREDLIFDYGKQVWSNYAPVRGIDRAGREMERHLERMVREQAWEKMSEGNK
ncbi:uncharacterized protein AB675_11087 [Cyphellophora attinorum]|uniref:Uncharacterized protein n=1 Tax=Cyphellophora attinorum TaxID=1664694 RepID=A0A0N1GYI5_9EURO|nr:uncharacterized protein AB675_11087 [Phialophora attinorum]KPI35835.1 hypothetical protein AB675_11087 [Phialophora attinorum]